jgi:hypothetical protein
MKRFSLLALVALAACATVRPGPSGPQPTAGFGELARAGHLTVRPLELLEDSRCPASVQCVWAGQVRIRAEIIGSAGAEVRELTLGKPVAVGGGTLRLIEVEPPKVKPGATDPSRYWFAFEFVPARA